MRNCPKCALEFDVNDSQSTHQVNDNDEQTYCSYECSAVGTLNFLRQKVEADVFLSPYQLEEIISNT